MTSVSGLLRRASTFHPVSPVTLALVKGVQNLVDPTVYLTGAPGPRQFIDLLIPVYLPRGSREAQVFRYRYTISSTTLLSPFIPAKDTGHDLKQPPNSAETPPPR